jgi:hypothetical protein
MARTSRKLAARIGTLCRRVAVVVMSGVARRRPIEEIDAALRRRPVREQALITGGILALLLALSLAAAQFGWIGMLVFWLLVIVLVN